MVRISRSACFYLLLALVSLAGSRPVCVSAFDLVLLLDESGSMKTTDPGNARVRAAELFARICRQTDRVALMGFATNVREMSTLGLMGPGTARDELEARLRLVRSDGQWTDIEQALRLALQNLVLTGDRSKPRAVLLMTDGRVDLAPADANLPKVRFPTSGFGALVSDFIQENIPIYSVAFLARGRPRLAELLVRGDTGVVCAGGFGSGTRTAFPATFRGNRPAADCAGSRG
jgi:hypothetical protein